MKFTVQYIPLNKLKPDASVKMTQHINKLRGIMWDCMHLLAVRKNKKDGSYTIVSGLDRYEYLRKHTNKKSVACVVDNSAATNRLISIILRHDRYQSLIPPHFSEIYFDRMVPKSWSILRAFLKEEARFSDLSHFQQAKILLCAIRYKKTVVLSMKAMVDDMLS